MSEENKDAERARVVDAMCMTWRHDFGLDRKDDELGSCGMTDAERDALRRKMGQLYDHHFAAWQRAQSAPAGERDSYWFSLVMNCAAELETASYCMTDTEAKRVAQSGAGYYRDQARAAWQRAQGAVPDGYALVPVEPTPAMRVIGARDCSALIQPDQAGEIWRAMLGAVVVPAEYAFAAAPAHPAARQEQEGLHVWRATTRFGETCHFGEASTARAWAGENGTVERVELTPVPELRVVERQEQGEVQRLREALEFYARGDHLLLADPDAWDTCSGDGLACTEWSL